MVCADFADRWRGALDNKQLSISSATTETDTRRTPAVSWARESNFSHVCHKLL